MKFSIFFSFLILLYAFTANSAKVTSYNKFSSTIGYSNYLKRSDLTETQKTALDNYKSTSVYEQIQDYIIDPDKYANQSVFTLNSQNKIEKQNAKILGEFIKDIQSAIYLSPSLPGGLFLFRGQSDIQLVKGEIFERKEFTSTSLNPHEAEKFNRGALLYIRIPPRGYPGILTGKWEEEVLLPAGTRFLIVDRKSNSEGLLRILVEPCMETCRQPDTVLKEIGSGWTSLE